MVAVAPPSRIPAAFAWAVETIFRGIYNQRKQTCHLHKIPLIHETRKKCKKKNPERESTSQGYFGQIQEARKSKERIIAFQSPVTNRISVASGYNQLPAVTGNIYL